MSKTRFYLLLLWCALAWCFLPAPRDVFYGWRDRAAADERVLAAQERANAALVAAMARLNPVEVAAAAEAGAVPAVDDLSLNTGPTYTAADIEALLQEFDSPAAGKGVGEASVEASRETGVDNAYWFWMFVQESTAGTAYGWAGRKGEGDYTANTGNIICAGYATCYGRFRDYQNDWALGTREHIKLLACYRDGGGEGCSGLWTGQKHATIVDAINTWAPPSENDTRKYAQYVADRTQEARRLRQGRFVKDGDQKEQDTTRGVLVPVDSYKTPPISLGGCKGVNIRSAINSTKAFQGELVLPPGADWSFNGTWLIDENTLVVCGVYGGGVCSLAAGYSNAARHIGLVTVYHHHGIIFEPGLDYEDQTAIWSSGKRGGQDLVLKNTTNRTAHLLPQIVGGNLVVSAWWTDN
jgi:hypothetical protein